jgi:hypothetical protein
MSLVEFIRSHREEIASYWERAASDDANRNAASGCDCRTILRDLSAKLSQNHPLAESMIPASLSRVALTAVFSAAEAAGFAPKAYETKQLIELCLPYPSNSEPTGKDSLLCELLHSLAHKLRNPLQTALVSVQVLVREHDSAPAHRAEQAVLRLKAAVDTAFTAAETEIAASAGLSTPE